MPIPRHYATNADRQAAYRARRAAHVVASMPAPPPVPGYRRWAALLTQARRLLEEVAAEMTVYEAERSEAWRNSERGEQFTDQLTAVEEILDLLRDQADAAQR